LPKNDELIDMMLPEKLELHKSPQKDDMKLVLHDIQLHLTDDLHQPEILGL